VRGDEPGGDAERRAARTLFAAMGSSGWVAQIDARLAREAAA
jgi:hypothetical protein